MDTDSFNVHEKLEDVYEDLAEHVETNFNKMNYRVNIPLPINKNKNVIVIVRDKLGGKILKM